MHCLLKSVSQRAVAVFVSAMKITLQRARGAPVCFSNRNYVIGSSVCFRNRNYFIEGTWCLCLFQQWKVRYRGHVVPLFVSAMKSTLQRSRIVPVCFCKGNCVIEDT